jgi:5-keto-L-gluconate epimerase
VLRKLFVETGNGVMIGILLDTMQRKANESQAARSSFGLENTLVACQQKDRILRKYMPSVSYILVEKLDSFGSFADLQSALRHIKALGYDGVELNLTPNVPFEMEALARFTESIQLPVVSFLTGANYFSEGLCLSSPEVGVRDRAVSRLHECAAIASRFGALLVIGQMQGFLSDEPDRSTGEARIESCLKQVVERTEPFGTTIAFEPVNHLQVGFHNTLEAVMALARRIESPRFKPMLDSFHMNIEEVSLTEAIYQAGHALVHFHLCESNGSLLGSGHLDFAAIFAALEKIEYRGFASVKVYRQSWKIGAEASVRYLQDLIGAHGMVHGV